MVKERTDRAVRPFVRDAKQDFSVLAEPMRSDICVTLRIRGRSGERDAGSEGPESTTEGSAHSFVSCCWVGGGPMIAPSMKVIGMGSGGGSVGGDEKRARSEDRRRRGLGGVGSGGLGHRRQKILFTVLGEMAFKSMYTRSRGAAVVPRRTFRPVMPAGELQASAMRRAAATASRGGTILSTMSACETSSASLARRMILAAFTREIVDELSAESAEMSKSLEGYGLPASCSNSHHWKVVRSEQFRYTQSHFSNGQYANGWLWRQTRRRGHSLHTCLQSPVGLKAHQ